MSYPHGSPKEDSWVAIKRDPFKAVTEPMKTLETRVFTYLCISCDHTRRCFPSTFRIARDTHIAESKVKSSINGFIEAGLIRWTRSVDEFNGLRFAVTASVVRVAPSNLAQAASFWEAYSASPIDWDSLATPYEREQNAKKEEVKEQRREQRQGKTTTSAYTLTPEQKELFERLIAYEISQAAAAALVKECSYRSITVAIQSANYANPQPINKAGYIISQARTIERNIRDKQQITG